MEKLTFSTLSQVKEAADRIAEEQKHMKSKRYPQNFKEAVCTFLKELEMPVPTLTRSCTLNDATVYLWQAHMRKNSVKKAVVRPSKTKVAKVVNSVREMIQQQIDELTKKLSLVDQCEAAGLHVTAG